MTSNLTPIQRELRGNRDNWRLLRTKRGTQDDPDFVGLQLDPRRTMILVVGGTAANGAYEFDFSYTDADGEAVTGQISFTRTTETNTQLATALEGEIDGEADLAPVVAATTDTGATVTIELTALGQGNLVLSNFAAPVGATLDAEQNLTTTLPTRRDAHLGPAGKLFIKFVPINISGARLAPGTCTATIQGIDCIDRDTTAHPEYEAAIGGTEELAGQEAYIRGDLAINGSQAFTTRLETVANAPAGTVAIEVWVREAVS